MAITLTKRVASVEQRATLAEIREHILAVAETASEDNVIEVVAELDQGGYSVTEPLVFSTEEDPALKNIRLTVKAKPSMRPVISGLRHVSGAEFTPVEGTPYYKYQLEKSENGEYPKFFDFFHGGIRMKKAISPDWGHPFHLLPEQRSGEVKAEGLYAPVEIAQAVKKSGIGATQLRMFVQWEQYTLRVKDVDLSSTVVVRDRTYALVKFYEEFDEYFVRGVHSDNNIRWCKTFFANTPAYLTEPDTFAYDWTSGAVYVVPTDPSNMAKENYGYSTLSNCFVFKGMTGVTLEGLTFTGLTSSFICETGYFASLSNREKRAGKLRHAAVLTSDVRDFTVKSCNFLQLGGNGLMLRDSTVKATVEDCRFVGVAMCGISVGNYREDRDGKFIAWEYACDEAQNRSYHVMIENNYLEDIAYDYPSSAAIFLGFCDVARIMYNTINGCAYSGIAAGDGYTYHKVKYQLGEKFNLRDVEIAYNRVVNFMDVCRDGGAVYVTGANCTVEHAPRFNTIHHNFAVLEKEGPVDRVGYYLDGSASNWDVYDNVIIDCQMPLFIQHSIPGQFTYHNRAWNIYSTTPISEGNHTPWRDVLLDNCFVEADGCEALYQKHPEAKTIADGAGYRDTGIK